MIDVEELDRLASSAGDVLATLQDSANMIAILTAESERLLSRLIDMTDSVALLQQQLDRIQHRMC